MIRFMERLGDRALERLVPKATASADVTYLKFCYCRNWLRIGQTCLLAAGHETCGPCNRTISVGC